MKKWMFVCCLCVALGFLVPDGVRGQAAGEDADLARNRAVYQSSAANYDNTGHLTTDGNPRDFWQSAPGAEQWVYVDLGQSCSIDRVQLVWGPHTTPLTFKLQVSDEAGTPVNWRDVHSAVSQTEESSNIAFPRQKARYVRALLQAGGETGGYVLHTFSVFGARATGPAAAGSASLVAGDDGTATLDDDSGLWKVQREDFVTAAPEALSALGADTRNWLPGLVPGTTLTSYLKAGAVPDPRYGDQQFQISEEFFNNHDFWFRREFIPPASYKGKHVWLNFDGINWKADIYLNGARVGRIDGAFIRSQFDISSGLQWGKPNTVAVLIHKMKHPGRTDHKILNGPTKNGSEIGLDSPTFMASTHWNWIPSIRGRDTGIWNHVYLRATGDARISDPFVASDLSTDHGKADLTVRMNVANATGQAQTVAVAGTVGNIHFGRSVTLVGNATMEVVFDVHSNPELSISQPQLWWPNGYGGQPLYKLHVEARTAGALSDQRDASFGIRKLSYDISDKILKISVNDHRIMCNGGNWGMPEAMLLYKEHDYDTAVHLHQDMRMVMIRNWAGQTASQAFYDACDKYGILVWDDFWMVHHYDGPDPEDETMFIANMRDKVLQVRNHPSVALYCGRNEEGPPKRLDAAMRLATQELDGTRFYVPNSRAGVVTGGGPYAPMKPEWYFANKGKTFHSELGIVCVPTVETMRLMMPEKDLWPINNMWGLHDFHQPRAKSYISMIGASYGPSGNVQDFCEKAQMFNMETSKAMLECWRSNRGSGGLVWMSHPAWPSLICQLYDYYLNPTAAYFGIKKACEPVHILWNSNVNQVQAANDTLADLPRLTAEASVFDMNGNAVFQQSSTIDCKAGTAASCFPLDFTRVTTPVSFIKLKLSSGGKMLSENFYWHGTDAHYAELSQMPRVRLTGKVEPAAGRQEELTRMDVTVTNPASTIALMVCLKVVRDDAARERVLPIYYEDNYFTLMPHETRKIAVRYDASLLGNAKPLVLLQGWNVDERGL